MATGITTISDWTDVCNRALAKIGKNSIESLTDGSPQQKQCVAFLSEAIIEILDTYSYQAPVKEIQLAMSVDTPLTTYAYQYPLPADLLRIEEVNTNETSFVIEGNNIKTDAEEVYLKYSAMPENPATMPQHIIRAISTNLALKICIPLIKDEVVYNRLEREMTKVLREARITESRNKVQADYESEMGFKFTDELR